MAFIAVGIGVGTLGAGIAGSMISSGAARDAANAQSSAADRANQLQYQMYQQNRADQTPWRQSGISALYGPGGLFVRKDGGTGTAYNSAADDQRMHAFIDPQIENLANDIKNAQKNGDPRLGDLIQQQNQKIAQLTSVWQNGEGQNRTIDSSQYQVDPELTRSFTMDDFQKDPGYDFRMSEGQKALERSAAAKGGLQSGGFEKALSRYGQDYASNEYQNAYNRFNNDRSNRFNRLSALAGGGQVANSQMGQMGENYANSVGQNMIGSANAQGAAGIASANAWGGALNNAVNAGTQGLWMSKWNNSQTPNPITQPQLSTSVTNPNYFNGGYSNISNFGNFGYPTG